MLLTSKEQALLTIAVDRYLTDEQSADYRTAEIWGALYDAIIDADIDDVGDEYDPLDALFDYDDDCCEICGDFHGDEEDYEVDEEAFSKWLDEQIALEQAELKQKKVS
jgi:hypothetical protein